MATVSAHADERARSAVDALRACASEKDDDRRLSCYDREIARADAKESSVSAAVAAPAPPAPAPPAATPSPDPDAKFGYRGSIARQELDREAEQTAGVDRLEATVTAVSAKPRGALVLTLDNGQVWAQKTADATRLKVGDRVVIKKASFGSFLLVAPNNRTTRVTRER